MENTQNIAPNISDNAYKKDGGIQYIQKSDNVIVKDPQTGNPTLDHPVLDDPALSLHSQSNTKEVITKDDIYPHLHSVNIYRGSGRGWLTFPYHQSPDRHNNVPGNFS